MSETTVPAAWQTDPGIELTRRWAAIGEGLPANPGLSAELCWSVRERGDWLAAMIAPSYVRIFLLPGGGELWGDIPLGQRRYLALGNMDWRFSAARDAVLGDYQYVDLVRSSGEVASQAAARHLASDARLALGLVDQAAIANEQPAKPVSRRGFLRALSGRR